MIRETLPTYLRTACLGTYDHYTNTNRRPKTCHHRGIERSRKSDLLVRYSRSGYHGPRQQCYCLERHKMSIARGRPTVAYVLLIRERDVVPVRSWPEQVFASRPCSSAFCCMGSVEKWCRRRRRASVGARGVLFVVEKEGKFCCAFDIVQSPPRPLSPISLLSDSLSSPIDTCLQFPCAEPVLSAPSHSHSHSHSHSCPHPSFVSDSPCQAWRPTWILKPPHLLPHHPARLDSTRPLVLITNTMSPTAS